MPRFLSTLFRIDGAISAVFGLAILLFQTAVFSTAVDLKSAGASGAGDALIESLLQTLSGYYLLVGCALVLLARVPAEYATRLAVVVAVHHGFMAVKGVFESDRAWVTGNPWWDVGIHLAFAAGYVVAIALGFRRSKQSSPGGPLQPQP